MNTVQPIRDSEKLEELKKNGTRDDVRNSDVSMKQHITVTEKKTEKQKRFPLCNGLLAEIKNTQKI